MIVFCKNRVEKNANSFSKGDGFDFIKHICSNVFRDSIRNFFLELSLKIPGKKLSFSAVDFVRKNYTKLKLRKFFINFICQLLIEVLKIHKKFYMTC